MAPPSDDQGVPSSPIEDSIALYLKQPILPIAPALDDLRSLATCLQRIGKLDEAERLLRRAFKGLGRNALFRTYRASILADLAYVSQQRGDDLESKELLLQAVDCLADTDRDPSVNDRLADFEKPRNKLFRNLADRLVQVHRELGDQEGAKVWQAKIESHVKTGLGL